MLGLNKKTKLSIGQSIDDLFMQMIYRLIGDTPQLEDKKSIIFTTNRPTNTLAKLYFDALGQRKPNPVESNIIENNIAQATEYYDNLREKTRQNVINRVDGYVKNKQTKKDQVLRSELNNIIGDELKKAGSHIKKITMAEATKARNVGNGLDIISASAATGEDDPTVFFVVIKDDTTCLECRRLHLMPDGITPRVWKFSELSQDYHKKGNATPSINGLHPHCRCTLSVISKGFGFDSSGLVTYKSIKYDAFSEQKSADSEEEE